VYASSACIGAPPPPLPPCDPTILTRWRTITPPPANGRRRSNTRAQRAPAPTFQRALDAWHRQPGAEKWTAVRLHRKLISLLVAAPFPFFQRFEAAYRASIDAGLKLVEGEPPHPETVRLLAALGFAAWVRRTPQDWDTAERYTRAAVSMAEQLDAPVELSI